MYPMNKFKCFACKKSITNHSEFTTGYGLDEHGHKICFFCCAILDKEIMDMEGKISLYLCRKDGKYYVTNWPGTLSFNVRESKIGMHNLAKRRTDVWFIDHNSDKWHGVSYGEFTQVCHCRRINDPEEKFLKRMFRNAA
jgi:hypothetical protein